MGEMTTSLAIGDFARAAHMSHKTLRFYHRVGVLVPAYVDPDTGYRRYRTDQIPVAQVIRRFRGLDMPLEDIQAVLAATDVTARNELIASHLRRVEATLQHVQDTTALLRRLLEAPTPTAPPEMTHLSIPATPAAAITATIDIADAPTWYQGALGELHASLASQHAEILGPAGGIFSNALFAEERGQATVYMPCNPGFRATGRIEPLVTPAAEVATTTHTGPHHDIDQAYGALATYVAEHALSVDGPIREIYHVECHITNDESKWRTQIGWPIFRTAHPT